MSFYIVCFRGVVRGANAICSNLDGLVGIKLDWFSISFPICPDLIKLRLSILRYHFHSTRSPVFERLSQA